MCKQLFQKIAMNQLQTLCTEDMQYSSFYLSLYHGLFVPIILSLMKPLVEKLLSLTAPTKSAAVMFFFAIKLIQCRSFACNKYC